MIRALEEFRISGVATTIPADLAILRHDDFAAGKHSTKWLEDTLDLTGVTATPAAPASDDDEAPKVQRDVDVEVNGKRFAVKMWVPDRSEEHTSELQSLMRISYAVFCLKKTRI